jgi:predicted ribosome quality control (RQC) complex YloA/Tae2 family protein
MKRKNQLSSFDITVLTKELHDLLIGGFINKIYQSDKKEILIKITIPTSKQTLGNERPQSKETSKYKQINLVIKIGKFLYACPKTDPSNSNTDDQLAKPGNRAPGSYAMLLRKHLKNGKIIDIHQHEFDRIIVLDIQKKDKYELIIELFGDGNLILVKAGKIIQPLFSQSWSFRTIRAGAEVKYPPAKVNPIKLQEGEFCKLLSESKKDLVRALIMDLQIPGIYAEELCLRSKLDKNIKANQVSQKAAEKLFKLLSLIIQEIKTHPNAFLIYPAEEPSKALDLVPIHLEMYKELNFKELKSYNLAIEQFFQPKDTEYFHLDKITDKKTDESLDMPERVIQERSRLLRQKEQQNEAIERFSKDIELNHNLGEAIYSNYLRCEEILNKLNELRKKVEPDEVFKNLSNNKDLKEFNPHEGYLILKVKPDPDLKIAEIKLDIRKNVMENANHYYELSKHSKDKLQGAQIAIKHTKKSLDKLTTQAKTKPKQLPKKRITKHFWFEKYHWMLTSAGNIVVGGRDAKSNDQVVKRHMKDKDRYCHADISGASSVVIKHTPEDDEIPLESLQEACHFAVIYSKAWNAKLGAGSAYWVKPDQVSKTPQSGEFLARGAFVVRGKRNYMGNIKLFLAVGMIEYQGREKPMAGPVDAVKAYASKYIILTPGTIKKNEMANELSKLFNIAVDDILSLLPSGEFAVVEKVGFE